MNRRDLLRNMAILPLLSDGLAIPTAAVGSAFNRLSETTKKHEPTLEDVVRDTLRPMLKSWLEENLPSIVERMVQAEIERVTRGR